MLTAHELAVVEQAVTVATWQGQSPWATRAAAAAHCHCSVSELDRAADAGFFKRYHRGDVPMFKKAELDAAIEKGKWLSRKAA